MDVVNGLAPSGTIQESASSSPAATATADNNKASDIIITASEDVIAPPIVDTTTAAEPPTTTPNDRADERMAAVIEGGKESKGARRMAAMRKRRYANKKKDEETTAVTKTTVAENKTEESVKVEEGEFEVVNKIDAIPSNESSSADAPTTEVSPTTSSPEKENSIPSPTNSSSSITTEPKKYMGVAKMRRLRNAQQKEQRLRDIQNSEVLNVSSQVDMQRELVTEMAVMGMTASMMRKGGSGSLLVDESKTNLTSLAAAGGSRKKTWWWSSSSVRVLIPPMKLVPRMVTLILLFVAGLDLGMQPHHPFGTDGVVGDVGVGVARDLGKRNLIGHVTTTFTKPWEAGLGGKVANVVGLAPTAVPASSSFDTLDGKLKECIGEDGGAAGECVPPKDNGGKKKNGIKMGLPMEEEILTLQQLKDGVHRPRGVDYPNDNDDDAASEFDTDDDDDTAAPEYKAAPSSSNIDPIFQVDLEALLKNANLPFRIEYAAKVAIGFHRMWLYYLWTVPLSSIKSFVRMPKNLYSGWVANPPWILGVVLFIRLLIKVVLGNGKSSSSLDANSDKSNNGTGGKSGKGNMDVLEKGKDMAKNYFTSKFPKITLVGGTLMQVMKVDMYVVLCGLLIGLVMPTIKEDYLEPVQVMGRQLFGKLVGAGGDGEGAGNSQGEL